MSNSSERRYTCVPRKGAEDLFSLGRNGADIQLSLVLYISLESRLEGRSIVSIPVSSKKTKSNPLVNTRMRAHQDKNWGQRDDGDPGQNDSLEPPHVSSAAGIVAGILLGR